LAVPYKSVRDNRLELACITVLLYSVFAAEVLGVARSAAIDASVVAVKVALLLCGLGMAAQRFAEDRRSKRAETGTAAGGTGRGMDAPLLQSGEGERDVNLEL
jgi:hypothetical protein